MKRYLELLADSSFETCQAGAGQVAWPANAHLVWREVQSELALKRAKTAYLTQTAVERPDKWGRGQARRMECDRRMLSQSGLDTVTRSAAQALDGLPLYSARLLLTFELLQPLLSADDAPLYVVDNPVRKDAVFTLPHLSAAAVKGLSADAYRRAFPPAGPVEDEQVYRHDDAHALHLFGIADDGAEPDGPGSRQGRLHFSPVWFECVEYLVMNPRDKVRSTGTTPIPFEAVARHQSATLEVVYINPYGIAESGESDVRTQIARWLAAVASWWPAIGIGAKRLAGYGVILPVSAELQALGWDWNETRSAGIDVALNHGDKASVPDAEPLCCARASGEDSWIRLAAAIADEPLNGGATDG